MVRVGGDPFGSGDGGGGDDGKGEGDKNGNKERPTTPSPITAGSRKKIAHCHESVLIKCGNLCPDFNRGLPCIDDHYRCLSSSW